MLVELAIATQTPVLGWVEALDSDPRLVATAVAVLEEQHKQTKTAKGGGRR